MDLRLTKIEYVVLDLLRSGVGMYGLEMVKASNSALKRGTVYVTLGRMEEKGLISSQVETEPKHPGLPRRIYVISGVGQALLNAADAFDAARVGGGNVATP